MRHGLARRTGSSRPLGSFARTTPRLRRGSPLLAAYLWVILNLSLAVRELPLALWALTATV
jgi:hypothetical protein